MRPPQCFWLLTQSCILLFISWTQIQDNDLDSQGAQNAALPVCRVGEVWGWIPHFYPLIDHDMCARLDTKRVMNAC